MKKLVLIGGGEIGKGQTSYETENIDKEIVKMSEKENPNLLFIGLASSYSDSYYDLIKKIYKNLGCECAYLKKKNVINNPDIIKNKILNADIIYIGGGDTIKLMEVVKEYEIDKLLQEAYEKGTVLVGISAGGILLSKEGYSDSLILRGESDKYAFIDGLGFVNISFCPHYNADDNKKNCLFNDLENTSKEVYGVENCSAIKMIGDKISIIKSKETANVWKIKFEKNIVEEKI